ncbi:MAG: patatin-like phospholipase family protein, partial [bacterium]
MSARHGQVYPFRLQKRPHVGIALSGGGARGTAQIGVLKALEENHIPIDFISATSIGSIIGGLYASGYTVAEIESLALSTNWDELLSLSDEAQRTDLAIDQKLADDWSFLVVRFEGLQPVLPHAVSTGQRLTNFLSEKTLQGIYHPNPNFNDLKVPFRAVTTDLISGRRVVLDRGSLAEALRASSTVPLLFTPLERDTMRLVDGGLITNIPVDVAKDAGCAIVVAVNTTSGLRNAGELLVPWETADQIMGIMMQLSNQEQLKNADVTITPAVGRHPSSSFYDLDFLIDQGYKSTLQQIDSIRFLYQRSLHAIDTAPDGGVIRVFDNIQIEVVGTGVPDSVLLKIKNDGYVGRLTSEQIRKHIRWLGDTGNLKNVWVDVYPDASPVRVVYHLEPNATLTRVEFTGNGLVSTEKLTAEIKPLLGKWLNHSQYDKAIERILRLYRKEGYSLARISGTFFDDSTG